MSNASKVQESVQFFFEIQWRFFFLVILAFPVLISANIVVPFKRTVVKHEQQWNHTPSFPLREYTNPVYYTLKLRLGNPSKEFTLLMDTGSYDLWVSCKSNRGCPSSSKNSRDAIVFDPAASSNASLLPCSDALCSHCSQKNQCTYDTRYLDNDTTSGYYLKDMVFYDKGANSSAFVFGCSTNCSGKWSSLRADGIIGLGPGSTSFVSQLSALHKIPRVFSQCFMGDGGGGVLVFRNVSEPSIVYSPIDPTELDYMINVDSIFVGEKELPIPTKYSKVAVDSGSSTGYLVKEIYDSFVDAVSAAAAKSTTPNPYEKTCFDDFDLISPFDEMFPTISYKFKGGLTIVLRPEDYLVLGAMAEGQYNTWCINIHQAEINIIGDIFLRNKLVVYDYDQKLIGMANYDCSSLLSASSILQMFHLHLYYILAILVIMLFF